MVQLTGARFSSEPKDTLFKRFSPIYESLVFEEPIRITLIISYYSLAFSKCDFVVDGPQPLSNAIPSTFVNTLAEQFLGCT